jgi:hypothetical protein
MKVLFLIVLLLALGFSIYRQNVEITDLKASLADGQAKNTQLQTDLDNAKKEAAAVKAAQSVYRSPLSATAPTPTPTPSTDWMWNTKTSLDAPAKK